MTSKIILICIILSGCTEDRRKALHENVCNQDYNQLAVLQACINDIGCQHDAGTYADITYLNNDLKRCE